MMTRMSVLTKLTVIWRRKGSLSQALKTVPSAWSHTRKDLVGVIVFASPISFSSTETFAIFSRMVVVGPDGTMSRQLWKCRCLPHVTACCNRLLRRRHSCLKSNHSVGLLSVLPCVALVTVRSFASYWSIELVSV